MKHVPLNSDFFYSIIMTPETFTFTLVALVPRAKSLYEKSFFLISHNFLVLLYGSKRQARRTDLKNVHAHSLTR